MARVEIASAGRSVIIEADDPLEHVAGKALGLWRNTTSDGAEKAYAAYGFTAERAGSTEYVSELDVTLDARRRR